MEQFRPDLVLSGYALPRFDGMRALRLLLERDCSSPSRHHRLDNEDTVQCMKARGDPDMWSRGTARTGASSLGPEISGALKRNKEAEAALRKFDGLFNGNPAPMAVSSVPDARFTDVNDAFLGTLGYSREEVLGKTSQELGLFVRPEQQQALAEQLRTQGRIAHCELKVRCKDGTVLDGLFFGELIDSQGEACLLTVMVDQTERKRVEEELRTYSRMVEQSPVSVLVTDPAWKIEYVNPKFCEVTGYSSAEVIGKEPRILESGLTPPEVYAEIERAISTGGAWRGEFCNRRKNGELFWEDASICAIHDAEGRVTHLLGGEGGHHRPEGNRGGAAEDAGAVPAVAEAGGHRATGGRRGPRLQQPAQRDPRLHGDPPVADPPRGGHASHPRDHLPRGRPRGGTDASAAGFQPQAGPRAEGRGSRRPAGGHGGDAAPADRRGHRAGRDPAAGTGSGQDRSGAVRAGRAEPGRERAGRHARRGHPAIRAVRCGARAAARAGRSDHRAGALRPLVGHATPVAG